VAVSTESGAQIPCDAAWIATGLRAATGLAASLCDVDEAGFAMTSTGGRADRACLRSETQRTRSRTSLTQPRPGRTLVRG